MRTIADEPCVPYCANIILELVPSHRDWRRLLRGHWVVSASTAETSHLATISHLRSSRSDADKDGSRSPPRDAVFAECGARAVAAYGSAGDGLPRSCVRADSRAASRLRGCDQGAGARRAIELRPWTSAHFERFSIDVDQELDRIRSDKCGRAARWISRRVLPDYAGFSAPLLRFVEERAKLAERYHETPATLRTLEARRLAATDRSRRDPAGRAAARGGDARARGSAVRPR